MSSSYNTVTTPDGRWLLGWAEYNKKMSDVSGAPSQVSSLPEPLATLYKSFQLAGYALSSQVTLPMYYIFGKVTSAHPAYSSWKDKVWLGAEWPFHRAARDAAFSALQAQFNGQLTDQQRISLLATSKANAPKLTVAEVAKLAAASGVNAVQDATGAPPPADEMVWLWRALFIGGLGYVLYRVLIKR